IEEVVILLIQKFIFDDVLLDRLADSLIAKLNAESTTLPILRKQLAEIEKGIDNIVNAIQAGIFSNSTKQRLDELEAEKSELSVQILKEEISKPTITKEEILYYLTKYRKLNMKQLDHRRRLIDSFVNAIYLFDDYLVITFNYKEGTKTITFAEIEEAFGSDLSSLTAPKQKRMASAILFCFSTNITMQDLSNAKIHLTHPCSQFSIYGERLNISPAILGFGEARV
ncbi:MAG: hypothetical protein UH851_06645, partial [Clostridia bacterium]|nr:hypothetical protein [Clostridia bacterium]